MGIITNGNRICIDFNVISIAETAGTTYLGDISTFKEVSCLENLHVWHSVLFDGFLKGLDVFHQHKIWSFLLDFLHRPWTDFVDELAQDNSVLQHLLIQEKPVHHFTSQNRMTLHQSKYCFWYRHLA